MLAFKKFEKNTREGKGKKLKEKKKLKINLKLRNYFYIILFTKFIFFLLLWKD